MSCEDNDHDISTLVSNEELPEGRREELETHMYLCTRCQEVREDYEELDALLALGEDDADEPDWDAMAERTIASILGTPRATGRTTTGG